MRSYISRFAASLDRFDLARRLRRSLAQRPRPALDDHLRRPLDGRRRERPRLRRRCGDRRDRAAARPSAARSRHRSRRRRSRACSPPAISTPPRWGRATRPRPKRRCRISRSRSAATSLPRSSSQARATAQCIPRAPFTSGETEIDGLTIDGVGGDRHRRANQTVALAGGGQVILNEQSTTPGAITVTAIHVIISGAGDVMVASAHAEVVCGSTCPRTMATSSPAAAGSSVNGAKATFSISGGTSRERLLGRSRVARSRLGPHGHRHGRHRLRDH